MLSLILAAAIEVEACAKYGDAYVPPPAAVAAADACGECDLELAERFANGEGVERDFEIAEYFLCKAESRIASAEFEGMMEHLQRMRHGEETSDLRFCDHVTSGYGSMYCTHLRHEEAMPRLAKQLDALRERVTVKARFDALRERGEAYTRAESERIGEQSRGGTGYAAIGLAAEIEEMERFVAAAERWASERAPAATPAVAARADAELNAAYRAARDAIDEADDETIADWKVFLRDAQRAWIAYRDAFAAFYVEQWHGAAAPAALRREIVTALTRDRTDDLRKSF